jgi:hypothetical protein
MAQVFSLGDARRKKNENNYLDRLNKLSKLELLGEMVEFQEERSRKGRLDKDMRDRGFILFQCLIKAAETKELRDICANYLNHLKSCKV